MDILKGNPLQEKNMKLWFNTRHTAVSLPVFLVALLLVPAVCWLRPAAALARIAEMRSATQPV